MVNFIDVFVFFLYWLLLQPTLIYNKSLSLEDFLNTLNNMLPTLKPFNKMKIIDEITKILKENEFFASITLPKIDLRFYKAFKSNTF